MHTYCNYGGMKGGHQKWEMGHGTDKSRWDGWWYFQCWCTKGVRSVGTSEGGDSSYHYL